ncbi:iron complex transport system ATP-binding protein [Conyzicola lurida]|uniref:Iron complex transport system ATP-binding protein n=1 Tax=Conyzicola lurida TaxID=1172621 RepID=A0A841AR34_9MICO|nr:heme ABC transporter ATP-binding protein [Conyzicola lurida]MBB5844744.1 iron complex transport system ATP-binding protein [Conyzicola lurida]
MIRAEGVGVAFDAHPVLDGVSIDIVAGELLALVGPNGAGKSTLLSVLSGDVTPSTGSVRIDGRDIRSIRHVELARLRSVLTQENQVSFPFTVAEVVEMGRSPWARTADSADDEAAIAEAIRATDVAHLAARRYTSLSGGEKARVSLARVLAQGTPTVFLDEPTAALDLRHQEEVMATAAVLARAGRAVVVVVHDLSLAAAYADRVALIASGRLDTVGTPAEVLTAERVERVYGLPVEVREQNGRPVILPVRGSFPV